jgi:hypothetical protein
MPPAQSYPPPQGPGGYAPPPPTRRDSRGFFARLFDFSFGSFITPTIIKVIYILLIIVIALMMLTIVIVGFTQSVVAGLLALIIGAPIGGFLYILFARVWLEIIIVLFRIHDNTEEMARGGMR